MKPKKNYLGISLLVILTLIFAVGLSSLALAEGDGGAGDGGSGSGGDGGGGDPGNPGGSGDPGNPGGSGDPGNSGGSGPEPSSGPAPEPQPQPQQEQPSQTDSPAGGDGDGEAVPEAPPVVVVNTAPTLSIPDQTVNGDAGLLDNLVDLFSNVVDDFTSAANMIFSFVAQTNANLISCSLDSGRFIDCITQSNQNGFSDITISATDEDGLTTFDTFRINVQEVEEPPTTDIRNIIYIGLIAFDKEFYRPGDELNMFVNFENKGDEDIKDARLTAIIQDLGIRSKTAKAQVTDGNEESKTLVLELPEDAKPGRYWVELVIDTDGNRRVKFRPIDII